MVLPANTRDRIFPKTFLYTKPDGSTERRELFGGTMEDMEAYWRERHAAKQARTARQLAAARADLAAQRATARAERAEDAKCEGSGSTTRPAMPESSLNKLPQRRLLKREPSMGGLESGALFLARKFSGSSRRLAAFLGSTGESSENLGDMLSAVAEITTENAADTLPVRSRRVARESL